MSASDAPPERVTEPQDPGIDPRDRSDELQLLRALLESDARIDAAWVFGSVAHGRARPDSDLDLALIYTDDDARTSIDHAWLSVLGRWSAAAGRDIHPVDLERANPTLRKTVFDTGKRLFCRDEARVRKLRYVTAREYVDWEYARNVIDAAHARKLSSSRG